MTNQAFRVEDDSVTFDLNGRVYITTSASPITIGTSSALPGSLTIIDGNVAATANSTPSLGTGGAGFLTVGAGRLLAGSAMDIMVGGAGGGTLTVNGGGDIVAESLIIGNQVSPSPLSQATISGTSSAFAGADVTVGRNGAGSLRISAGGAVESSSGIIGDFAGSGGLVIVENTGSRWINSGSLVVGDAGNGDLLVNSGGRVTSDSGVIGRMARSVSHATVTGANSQWSLDLGLAVGNQGTGSLTVDDGGTVTAPGGLSVGPFGTLRGDGQINGNVENVGVVAPGTSSDTLHINGHYTQEAGGKLQIEIGGTAPGSQFDMLDITGQATLNGTLQVSFIDGFSPTGSTVFEVVHADGGVIGSFDTLLLPPLPDGSAWAFAETSVSFF